MIPRIKITRDVLNTLDVYTDTAPGEFSVVGMVTELPVAGGVDLLVDEIFLPKQANTAGYTDIDDSALLDVMRQVRERGDSTSRMRCWIHSHAKAGVFWSTTDTDTIAKWAPSEGGSPSYLVSMVVNKAGDYKLRLDVFTPPTKFGTGDVVTFDDQAYSVHVDANILGPYKDQLKEATTVVQSAPVFDAAQDVAFNACVKRYAHDVKKSLVSEAAQILSISSNDATEVLADNHIDVLERVYAQGA